MPRRKELKNIASGILGSFISRNNDVVGYWGIGQLNLHAHRQSVTKVCIELISCSISPPNTLFSKLVSGYRDVLIARLNKMDIHPSWVAAAIIELDFKPDVPFQFVPMTTWGTLFKLTVSITDDRGIKHAVTSYGYSGSHDPKKETRSMGKRF